jgi:hypothetical protein
MARLIPNERSKIHFVPTVANLAAPTVAQIIAGVDLTGFLVTFDASTSGNTIPTPSFDSLFETSISGTVSATFTAEFYRDDANDLAWETLPRGTNGFFVVSRFGWSGANPVAGDDCEVWPVRITTRSAMALTNNESQRMMLEAAIPVEPNENAVVAT